MWKKLPRVICDDAEQWWQSIVRICPDLSDWDRNSPELTGKIRYAAGISDFVADTCAQQPGLIRDLVLTGDLENTYPEHRYADTVERKIDSLADEKSLGDALRKIRAREMVRIAIRDLAGIASLSECNQDLTHLATACVSAALSFLYQIHKDRYGVPKGADGHGLNMVVFALGKLGAGELNFSSDIDLMFGYPQAGEYVSKGKTPDAGEFFTRLARAFLQVFGPQGGQGNLFRVDVRLRPFGESGPLISSFSAMEDYYVSQGREWERYALIKARAIAGDITGGNAFLESLSPFVYRRYLDYGVYDALREMKGMIEDESLKKGLGDNVKLGPGGIRDIEFFAQVFQLLRGGLDPEFRNRELLNILSLLEKKGNISASTVKDLKDAYVFLRRSENRLQAFADCQTHDLPKNESGRLKLSLSMGYRSWAAFFRDLETVRGHVQLHFGTLLGQSDRSLEPSALSDLGRAWNQSLDETDLDRILRHEGFKDPGACARLLMYLKNDPGTRALSPRGRQRLDRLIPRLLMEAGCSPDPDQVFSRLVDLVKTIEQRTSYIALLIENPSVLKQLVSLAYDSPWLVSYLAIHPLLLDELIDSRHPDISFEKKDLEMCLGRKLGDAGGADVEQTVETLTVFKLTQSLNVAMAEVRGFYSVMKASSALTCLAETLLEKVMAISWAYLTGKHGFPPLARQENEISGFAVAGYGKLGGKELGYASDLDLVFLYTKGEGETDGPAPMATSHFYARMGQRILHLLSTHTRAGKMYDTDMRLRPSGNSGPIVSSMDAFQQYLQRDAWTFEHQALVRARGICGDPCLIRRFERIRMDILSIKQDTDRLRRDIQGMRSRMRKELSGQTSDFFNIKKDMGGMVDIEFMVQYLVLAYCHENLSVARHTDNIRQLDALAGLGVITKENSSVLKEAYLAYRKEVHKLDLQEKPPVVPGVLFRDLREKVITQWNRYINEGWVENI